MGKIPDNGIRDSRQPLSSGSAYVLKVMPNHELLQPIDCFYFSHLIIRSININHFHRDVYVSIGQN
jgi:hypothetical protein